MKHVELCAPKLSTLCQIQNLCTLCQIFKARAYGLNHRVYEIFLHKQQANLFQFLKVIFSKSRKIVTNLKFVCNQRQFHFKGIPNTNVDCTFSEDFAALTRKKPSLFRSTCTPAVTLPSGLVSWDRFKGLKRQGRKDGVDIDSRGHFQ